MAGDSVAEGLEVEMEEERVVEERVVVEKGVVEKGEEVEEVGEERPCETSFLTKVPIRGHFRQLSKQLYHQNRHRHAPDSHDYLS